MIVYPLLISVLLTFVLFLNIEKVTNKLYKSFFIILLIGVLSTNLVLPFLGMAFGFSSMLAMASVVCFVFKKELS